MTGEKNPECRLKPGSDQCLTMVWPEPMPDLCSDCEWWMEYIRKTYERGEEGKA